jgi:hypothetical protein
MALTVQLSKEFAIMYGGNVILYATDFSLEINKETIDITKLGDSWKNKVVDLKGFTVSFNGIVTRGETSNSHIWHVGQTYALNAYVLQGGKGWKSQAAGNVGFNPETDSGAKWLEIGTYAAGTTYALGDLIYYITVANEKRIYKSLQATNLAHDPGSSPTWWERLTHNFETLVKDILDSNLAVKCTIKPSGATTVYLYGDGVLSSMSPSITVGDKVTFSGTFEGTGALTAVAIP